MHIRNTQVIVLKRNPSGDTSLNVHVFSEEDGRIILVAKGARGMKSRWLGHLEPFSLLNVHYYDKPGRPWQLLQAVEIIDSFDRLKRQPPMLLYGSVILEILDRTQLDHSDPMIFRLLTHILKNMADGRVDAQYLYWYFCFIFLRLNGVGLNIRACSHCGNELSEAVFHIGDASFYCRSCHPAGQQEAIYSGEALHFLQHMEAQRIAGLKGVRMEKGMRNHFDGLFHQALTVHFDALRTLKSLSLLKILGD